jgi:hypothetical protein
MGNTKAKGSGNKFAAIPEWDRRCHRIEIDYKGDYE